MAEEAPLPAGEYLLRVHEIEGTPWHEVLEVHEVAEGHDLIRRTFSRSVREGKPVGHLSSQTAETQGNLSGGNS